MPWSPSLDRCIPDLRTHPGFRATDPDKLAGPKWQSGSRLRVRSWRWTGASRLRIEIGELPLPIVVSYAVLKGGRRKEWASGTHVTPPRHISQEGSVQ